MTATAYVGTSGWRYPRWRGDFYPPGLVQRRELEYLAQRLPSAELNGSFYSLQRPESYRRWRDAVPGGFVFAVKGSRYVTHMLRLTNTRVALANFFASGVLALGPTLGPILWQLPERVPFDPDVLEAFLGELPRTTADALALAHEHDARLDGRSWLDIDDDAPIRYALEPRSESFRDPRAEEILRGQDVSLVLADTAGRWPAFDAVTADHVYVRLHGSTELYASGYTPEELDAWADRVRRWREDRDVYVYFDNDARGRAPHDAVALDARLR
ncbi:DUF72 domain-containing protein [Microbacterium enclense]|uniref:DUF72 domain-containing protein n=1 Tax=Microbacterium enclense TaxID=993073 RepID=A0A443JMQ2_9MICO|nr:DUF72 domain-containing protein [Microbacterium enclense]RWR21795.1 DUF72 domain-containing protein [Microbacterium enclense]